MDIKKFYGKLTAFANTPKYVFFLSLTIAALSTILYTLFLTDVTGIRLMFTPRMSGNWLKATGLKV